MPAGMSCTLTAIPIPQPAQGALTTLQLADITVTSQSVSDTTLSR